MTAWRQEAVARSHDRAAFDCGVPALNEYLRSYARQNSQAGGPKTFVVVDEGAPRHILGYYTLGGASVEFGRVPPHLMKGLGRHDVPAFLLARLAVDLGAKGLGLGSWMLFAAAERSLRAAGDVGGIGLIIDAKDERAREWYRSFGAIPLLDGPLRLVLPFPVIAEARRRVLPIGSP